MAHRTDGVVAPSASAPRAERLGGDRPLAGADGAVDGGQHQPAGHGGHGRAGRCRWRSCWRRSACCSSPTRSCGCASGSTTRAASTASSARPSAPAAGVVAGWALLGTYVFYGVVTSTAAGIFGTAALDVARHLEEPAAVGRVRARGDRAAARARPGDRAGPRRHAGAADDRGAHRGADPGRHGHRAGAAGHGHRTRRAPDRPLGVRARARHRRLGAVPRHRLRLPVLRRASRPRPRSARRPATPVGRSRARSSASRSSAASTSWSSRRSR